MSMDKLIHRPILHLYTSIDFDIFCVNANTVWYCGNIKNHFYIFLEEKSRMNEIGYTVNLSDWGQKKRCQ